MRRGTWIKAARSHQHVMSLGRKPGRLLLGSRVEDDPGHGHDGDLDSKYRRVKSVETKCTLSSLRLRVLSLYALPTILERQCVSAHLRDLRDLRLMTNLPAAGFDRCFMMGPDQNCRPIRRSVDHHTASCINFWNRGSVNRTGYLAGISSIARVSACERQAGQA